MTTEVRSGGYEVAAYTDEGGAQYAEGAVVLCVGNLGECLYYAACHEPRRLVVRRQADLAEWTPEAGAWLRPVAGPCGTVWEVA